MLHDLDTSQIKNWHSAITLIVFILINGPILWPFYLPVYVPKLILDAFLDTSSALRLISPRKNNPNHGSQANANKVRKHFVRLLLPVNFITAPLVADLFLVAISAIGRQEIHDGTLGSESTGISPYDVVLVFLTLGYIANSIEASGLIRYLVFRVLNWTGAVGHRLFLYLYVCFFVLGAFIGNDPIMLLFLFYMTRVTINILHPRAWIHTQFAIANIATGILVSSNPTNLVIAGAFKIRFINYTANMVVPIFATALILFPLLLYFVFADESLIPMSIKVHELSEKDKAKPPVNINTSDTRGMKEENENGAFDQLMTLESVLNPFLDKGSAFFGAIVMALAIILLLALNAVYLQSGGNTDFWVTLPAAFVMFLWDLWWGWFYRHERREISRKGRMQVERRQIERIVENIPALKGDGEQNVNSAQKTVSKPPKRTHEISVAQKGSTAAHVESQSSTGRGKGAITANDEIKPASGIIHASSPSPERQQDIAVAGVAFNETDKGTGTTINQTQAGVGLQRILTNRGIANQISAKKVPQPPRGRTTLQSILRDVYKWCQETFPTTTTALRHLPYLLVPFAFSMFVLVEGLVNKGWVPVFAHAWDHWATKTGTIGSVGGMAFLAVILSNFAGTNIGASILLSRVIQTWQGIHDENGIPISDRSFWATVYSMALGVNFGAFSMTFSASLTGIMWRTVMKQRGFRVRGVEFARVNFPIIAFAMTIGCTILLGEVYIIRASTPYTL